MKTINNVNLASSSAYAKPMKWHKFLIYFSLWIGALNSIATGISVYTGSHYGDSAAEIYDYFQGLQKTDASFGVLYIALGLLLLVTRFKLARYRKKAVNWLTWCYLLQPVQNFAYNLAVYRSTGFMSETFSLDLLSSLVVSLIMIIPTRIYYKKREELFTE